ncbi:hypothetical protein T4D_16442 [Trichinella pseudospiralis]|uniref:Uncharacterized protein n=1 Tax=Trichinella pseudospiralis TaxID=6337 RepID=A0A0V1FA38_TRIPS|nr:hypothetical protein T4D_16442 [Trichinella pseudospiralis]
MAVQTKSTIKLEQTTKLAIQKANLDIVMYKFTMNIDIFFPDLLENDNFKIDRPCSPPEKERVVASSVYESVNQ